MLHLAGFFEAADTTANFDVNAINDEYLDVVNNHLRLRRPMDLVAAYAGSASLNRARLDAPTLRLIGNPFIRPISASLLPPNDPNIMDLTRQPFRLQAGEEIALQVTAAPAMTENCYGLVWLSTGIDPLPRGNVYPIRFTSTTTATASVWSSLSITLDQQIAPGQYALFGGEIFSTNIIAHRWIIPDSVFRPGFLSTAAVGSRTHKMMYEGAFGNWGNFFNTSLPTPQVLCNAGDNSFVGWMYCIRVRDLAP